MTPLWASRDSKGRILQYTQFSCITMTDRPLVNQGYLETLLELDQRHETLLAELDNLDRRVCEVLSEVRATFQPDAPDSGANG